MTERHVPYQSLASVIADDDMEPGSVLHLHHEDGDEEHRVAIYFTESEWDEIRAIWTEHFPKQTLQRALVDALWKYGELQR